MNKPVYFYALSLIVATTLAACGGSDDGKSASFDLAPQVTDADIPGVVQVGVNANGGKSVSSAPSMVGLVNDDSDQVEFSSQSAQGESADSVSSAAKFATDERGISQEIGIIVPIDYTDEYSTVARGNYSGIWIKDNVIIRSQDDFMALWKGVYGGSYPLPQLPFIDFNESVVVAVFMGGRPTGGYSINIEEIVVKADEVIVNVIHKTPPVGSILTPAITAPFHMIKIPVVDKKVLFNRVK